jgi:hypothetical protein
MNKKITKSRKSSSIPAVQKEKDVGSVEKESFFTRVKKSLSKRKRLIATTLGSVAAIGALKHTLDMKKISDLNEKIEGVKKIFQEREGIENFFSDDYLMSNFFNWTSQLGLSEKRSVKILVELFIEFVFRELLTKNENMRYIISNYPNDTCTFDNLNKCSLLIHTKKIYGNITFVKIVYSDSSRSNQIRFNISTEIQNFILKEDFSTLEETILRDIDSYFIDFFTRNPDRIFNDDKLFVSFFSMEEMKKDKNKFKFVKGVVDFCRKKNIDISKYDKFNEFLTKTETKIIIVVNIENHTLELVETVESYGISLTYVIQIISKETFSTKNIENKK